MRIFYGALTQSDIVQDESPGRYKTSICALPISSEVAPVAKTGDNDEIGLFAPPKNDST